jgi:thioredoxin-related protein
LDPLITHAEILIINVSKFRGLPAEHKIQVVPTLIFFDKTGKAVHRHMAPGTRIP